MSQVVEEGLSLAASSFFLSRYSINLHSSASVLCACLSNVESIINRISLREGDGSGRTSGITSVLWKTIGVVSWRIVPCHVTSQRERKSSLRSVM
jgi:hypothetical protein